MDLYLQVGAKMMDHSEAMFQEWGGGTAILSPRDLNAVQLPALAGRLRKNGAVLLDPQFYVPRSDYSQLVAHDYWPNDYETVGFADSGCQQMLDSLAALNRKLETSRLIVPGERAQKVDDLWLSCQRRYVDAALQATDQPLLSTVCLGSDAVLTESDLALTVEQAEELPVDGFYLVLERPRNAYFTDHPIWLANAVDLAAGLRRLNKMVIVGYSNQQMLIMACAAVTAIAAGTWRNVRTFSTDRYSSDYGRDYGHGPTNWYYVPGALSEFKVEYLDIGVRSGVGEIFHTSASTAHAAPLFATPLPSASGWKQGDAFRHYLAVLRSQVRAAVLNSFDETVSRHREMLDRAEKTLHQLHQSGVFGQDRDFLAAIDANRSAVTILENTQGPVLRREWAALV